MRRMAETERLIMLYLIPAFSLRSFSAAIEALRLANDAVDGELYRWRVITSNGEPVTSSCGVRVTAEASLQSERTRLKRPITPSVAVVCGGSIAPESSKPLETWLRECRKQRIPLASLGGGTFALARAGLLDGRRCAVHWEQYPAFAEQFPDVDAVQTSFEIDRDVYSCSGGDVPFSMFLRLVEEDCDTLVMNRVCELGLVDRIRDAGERQRLPLQSRLGIRHQALINVIERMEVSVADPIQLDTLISTCGLSRRQIERLFHQEMGRSPARYYLEMRLERAHLLIVNSDLPVIDVAIACGFVSSSHFSKTYRENYGCTPQQTRMAIVEARKRQHAARAETQARVPLQALSA